MEAVINSTDLSVVVRPINGMQLAEGIINLDRDVQFIGNVPRLEIQFGESPEEVRCRLEQKAKAFYGADVVVEFA